MTAQHGILKPNPVLFELENRKKKPLLAHEVGEGAPCQKCLDKCPGFQLHFWRKHCINCRCGKIEHNVIENVDPGFFFVGRILDLPLRSKKEELQFCYGTISSDEEEGSSNSDNPKKKTKFDWIPPNVTGKLARKYFKELPEQSLPVAGSDGAKQRQRNLEKQFPVHDVEPKQCHDLTSNELQIMLDYVAHIKENVAGQGIIQLVTPPTKVHKLYNTIEDPTDPDWLPPPPPELLVEPPSPTSDVHQTFDHGTFRAVPYTSSEPGSNRTSPLPPRRKAETTTSPDEFSQMLANILESGAGIRCENCKDEIIPGQIAIQAGRAGPKKMWHPKCFACQTCKDMLVDLLYYYDDGGIYCARDYAERKSMPRCNACDELIFCVEYTGAEDKFWHIKHFCCWECDRPLGGHKYISVDGQPHCLLCYQNKHGKVCNSCGEYISPEDQRVSLGEQHWHARPECFHCNICNTSLIGRKLARKFGLVLCSSDCARKAASTLPTPPQSPSGLLTTDV